VATDDFGAACRVRQGVLDQRLLTSVHEHLERLELKESASGQRRVTADNPFLTRQQRSRLEEQGTIRPGLVTEAGDVLISVLETRSRPEESLILGKQLVADESVYVWPAWVGARVVQSEHLPREDLGPGAPDGVASLSLVRLVGERDLEAGDLFEIAGQLVVVAGQIPDHDAPRDPSGQPADVLLSASVARRLGMGASEQKMLAVAKGTSQAAEALQARSVGKYTLITMEPLGKGREAPQHVRAAHVEWLRSRGLTATVGDLTTLKSDDLLAREKVRAGIAAGVRLSEIDLPLPSAPDSAAQLTTWLAALGLNVRLEPDDGCVSLTVWPATTEELIARSSGIVSKAETIHYRTYDDVPGGIFCPQLFGPSNTRRRRRFGHIDLPAPIVPILWRLGNPSLLEGLLGLSPDEIERILDYQADVLVSGDQVRLAAHEAESPASSPPEWESLGTGGLAIRRLLECLPSERVPPLLRGRIAALAPEAVLVPPPDLRPIVLLSSGNFATSDLNDHLRRVINRRNRLVKLIELKAPQVILDNEKRMLQQTVDGLFANVFLSSGQVKGSDGRPLKCTLSMAAEFVLEPADKRVDWSGRARVLIAGDLPAGQALVPRVLFDELQLDGAEPVLLTLDDRDGAFVAVLPQAHESHVLMLSPQAAAALAIDRDEIIEAAIHRPLGRAARAEAMRLLHEGPPPAREHVPQAGWLQARNESELISGLVAFAMTGEAVRLDTPELLLVGGTGSVEFAPDGAPNDPISGAPRVISVPVPPIAG